MRRIALHALPILLTLACRTSPKTDDGDGLTDGSDATTDDDGDGFVAGEDCDDTDASVNPGATEVCDGIDNDCDDEVDEGVVDTFYADADADGYGDPATTVESCDAPAGYVPSATDCDDTDADIYPSASERCNGVDDDCDGDIDEDVRTEWYADADGDGYGDPDAALDECDPPDGYVDNADDCDDTTTEAQPGGIEVCDGIDNDCDGFLDEDDSTDAPTWFADVDGDGYGDPDNTTNACETPTGYVDQGRDCDDGDFDIFPGANELCDGVDNDCDGLIDDADPGVDTTTGSTWYTDSDSDGYGDAASPVQACTQPSGAVTDTTDCDDTDSAVNPAASEICNSVDDDCDGDIDDADSSVDRSTGSTWYTDGDNDGYGDAASPVQACTQPTGAVTDSTDCDDTDAAISPAATEVCNSVDDDCDGDIDDADTSVDTSTGSTWYTDGDADGYGGTAVEACAQPSGTVSVATDCDDTDAAINPAATEVCNGVDDDCDGDIDDADSTLDTSTGSTWYTDGDSDGYGGAAVQACTQPSGTVATSTDCDDTDAAVNPTATEVCNGVDDDCDGAIDDDDASLDTSTATTWYVDSDLDGYGDSSSGTTLACDEPSGYTDDDSDCDDADSDINPGASETCNGYDDDCDLVVDDAGDCPCAVEYQSGDTTHPYMFCTSAVPWTTASSNCAAYGYSLVSIGSAAENSWVDSTADTYSTAKWWTGFNDRSSEGTWVWESGEAVTYTNWNAGEPNDGGGNEDCGQINRFHPALTWNDEPCGSSFRYICEVY